jgi:hypothetical protein
MSLVLAPSIKGCLGCAAVQVLFWDVKQQQGARSALGPFTPAGPDGLFRPLQAGAAAVNGMATLGGALVTGHEDGNLCIFQLRQ